MASYFWCRFWWIFYWFWEGFGWIWEVMLALKIDEIWSQVCLQQNIKNSDFAWTVCQNQGFRESTCIKNLSKIELTSIKKQPSKQCCKLHRFGSQLGPILEGFCGASWCQNPKKIDLNTHSKNDAVCGCFYVALRSNFDGFWLQLGPNVAPEIHQNSSKIDANMHCILHSIVLSIFAPFLLPTWTCWISKIVVFP